MPWVALTEENKVNEGLPTSLLVAFVSSCSIFGLFLLFNPDWTRITLIIAKGGIAQCRRWFAPIREIRVFISHSPLRLPVLAVQNRIRVFRVFRG
jgi:hypothetical protein